VDVERLRASPVGQLVPISGTDEHLRSYSYFAFVPSPLPAEPELDAPTWSAVAAAAAALGRLKQACVDLPNPKLLIAPALAREAVDTSALEGTYGALADVLEARLPQARVASPEIAEIRAYERMANQAFEWVRERPITLSMLCQLLNILAEQSRERLRDPGQIRKHQVVIGPEDGTVQEARYIPPPPDDRLVSGLQEWEKWIGADSYLPMPLRCAMAHYQFEALHPFGDGNGRIGRLIVPLQLLRAGTITEPIITLSPWLLRRRSEYQEHLLRVSQTGDWRPWIAFFCAAVCEQSDRAVRVVDDLTRWLIGVRQLLNRRHWSGVIMTVVEDLIDWPVISMSFVASKYGVSMPAAKSVVDRLVRVRVLKETTGRSYGRIYAATAVIELVESM
jgi:Fic family protein